MWDSAPSNTKYLAGNYLLWFFRYKLLARLARMGYNALMTDTGTGVSLVPVCASVS